MSDVPAPQLPAAIGWLSLLRSWLQRRTGEARQPTGQPTTDAAGSTRHCFGKVRVLVVDDNPVNLMVISAMLESRDIVPLLAANGAEGAALACELQFDLILMDLQMPILDGLEATAAIRRFEATLSRPAVPVVAYSGTAPPAGVLSERGLNGSLRKPCTDPDLEECLIRWCPSYRAAPPVSAGAGNLGDWQSAPIRGVAHRAEQGHWRHPCTLHKQE